MIDFVLAVFFLAPFRCRNCRHRFFRFSKRIGNQFKLAHSEPASYPPERPHNEEARSTSAPDEPTIEIDRQPSILIVDEDVAIRRLLRRLLERQGYCISELANAQNLEPELNSNAVDLLITDLVSERQAGLDTVASLRSACPDLKVIVLSSFWAAEMQPTTAFPGVFAILPKPFLSASLLDTVRGALEQSAESRVAE